MKAIPGKVHFDQLTPDFTFREFLEPLEPMGTLHQKKPSP